MLNLRKSLGSVSPLMNCIYYSSKVKRGRPHSARNPNSLKKQRNFGPNPGIDSQLSALQLDKTELNDPEILDKFETQFWDSDKMHDMFTREKFIDKERLGLHQVLRKQFKEEKLPNMLFWDEKQEIKALHEEDPEKWHAVKLALSFPASPSIIKKILRTKWKLRSQIDIDRHDQRVRNNWEALYKDQLHIPNKELRDHLLTFSNRSEASAPSTVGLILTAVILSVGQLLGASVVVKRHVDENPTRDILKDTGVFSNIYQSYKKLYESKSGSANDKPKDQEGQVDVIEAGIKSLHYPPENDTFIIPKSVQNTQFVTNQPMTMEAMQKQILRNAERGKNVGKETLAFVEKQPDKLDKQGSFKTLKDPVGTTSEVGREEHALQEYHGSSEAREIREECLNKSQERSLSEAGTNVELNNSEKFIDLMRSTEHQERGNEEQRKAFQTAHLRRTAEESDALVKAVKNYMSHSSDSYPLNIKIPDEVWKKGALYRIKDRFYTDDGEFLYRVPGLSKE